MHRVVLCVVFLLLAAPSTVRAECTLEGLAEAADVTPRGASLRFGVAEQARISLEGTHATVQGITPVAFVGRARVRDVSVYLAQARDVRDVLFAEAGVPLGVVRERDGGVGGWISAGPARVFLSLPCDALSLSDSNEAPEPEVAQETSASTAVRIRDRVLRAFASARGGSALELRLRPGLTRDAWPDLVVVGARGTRFHVRAELETGVRLDAWIERDAVGSWDGAMSGCGCDAPSGGGCGHGYANQSYAGPARIRAGAELRDGEGHVWGHVVVDSSLVVSVSTMVGRWTRGGGESGITRTDTVWVESLPGLIADPCSGLAAQVDRDAVTLPTDD